MSRFRRIAAVALIGTSFTVASAEAQDSDIVDVAAGAGTFNTLVAALQAADLVDVLRGDGPFTVFAPTDDAFAALPDGTVESLLLPENKDQLVSILTYHVVAGNVGSADVVNLSAATTVQGSDIAISIVDGNVMVNTATVTAVDIAASNGVIHVIDGVILPPAPTAVESGTWGEVKSEVR